MNGEVMLGDMLSVAVALSCELYPLPTSTA
jgi:hypothetical protein